MRKTLFALSALIASPSLYAEIGAHVHGVAELTLAIDGSTLEIQLQSPAANIVGFEHKAGTQKQKKAVDNAKKQLHDAKQLFLITGSNCSLIKASVDVSGLIDTDNHHHEHHDDSSEHESHDEHDEHKKHNDGHSEVTADYTYRCLEKENINSLTVELFKPFPGLETINAQWVTDSKQGGAALTASNNTIILR